MRFVGTAIGDEQPVIHRTQQQVVTRIVWQAKLPQQGLGQMLGNFPAAWRRKVLPPLRIMRQRPRHAPADLQIGREVRCQLKGARILNLRHARQPRAILNHDHRPANDIAQSLETTVRGHHHQAQGIGRNQRHGGSAEQLGRDQRAHVDRAHDVPQHGLVAVYGATLRGEHTNAQDAFARRLPIPVGFEQAAVKPAQRELGQDPDGQRGSPQAERQQGCHDGQAEQHGNPDADVDQVRGKATKGPGDPVVESDVLRRHDVDGRVDRRGG